MRVLFIHQNFPGQFRHVAERWAADPNNQVLSIGQKQARALKGIPKISCDPARPVTKGIHHYIAGAESGILNGQSVLRVLLQLKEKGFFPDVVIGHSGWGETLYVKDVFPDTKLINYFEFFYHATGADTDFDPEYPNTLDDLMRIRTMNIINLLALDGCDAGISPTEWQRSLYPDVHRPRISVIHEGINTELAKPNLNVRLTLASGCDLGPDDEVVTYVARNLEPYRGFHVLMRTVDEICRRRPNCHVLIVGGDGVSYGRKLPKGQSYRQKLLEEVKVDPQRVHFLGQVPYATYLAVLQISTAHIYLTVPFVLSWSMLEAMAVGCLVIGSDTPPVREVLEHEKTGLLVDYFSTHQIADSVCRAIEERDAMRDIRIAARQHIVENYNFQLGLEKYSDMLVNLGVKPA